MYHESEVWLLHRVLQEKPWQGLSLRERSTRSSSKILTAWNGCPSIRIGLADDPEHAGAERERLEDVDKRWVRSERLVWGML